MIPIHSLLPQHFSAQERHEYLVNISLSRTYNVCTFNCTLSSNSFESLLYGPHNKVGYFITPLYLGEGYLTFAFLDTGDYMTWIQCEGCDGCFEFQGTKFNYTKSPSYAKISSSDPMCTEPMIINEGTCDFKNRYYSGQMAEGFLGKDNFFFKNSKSQKIDVYKDIVFGCATRIVGFKNAGGPNSLISGIFGLGPFEKISFIKQLDSYIKGRFSYCIPTFDLNKQEESIMYFGDAAQISGDDITQVKVISLNSEGYYQVNLNGISVDGTRLPIDPSIFEINQAEVTGFIIDSGAPYTALEKRAYDVLVQYVAKYFFEKHDWQSIPLQETNDRLCYKGRYLPDDSVFPSIIFHFQGKDQNEEIDMILDPKNMFQRRPRPNTFCMMVLPSLYPRVSLFGAFQQANFKFLFDIYNNLLYFVPQICQQN
ncbi:hypothetical protein RND81_07G160500 [Saponaria officinalis]|uniref:Peptidase A1 domain-containing protein n=1 Tax=Saponaria officinalis TaxID=3572 RepID=A0AAW1JUD4_SAPOF